MRLRDKVALITGSGSGIGEATARLFASEGASVVLTGRRGNALSKTADRIDIKGRNVSIIRGDVRKSKDCEKVVRETIRRFGRLDILVNNAGVFWETDLTKVRESEWDTIVDTNLKGCYLMSRYAVPVMLRQNSGSIVNISSILGVIAMPNSFAYNASKGGVVNLTRSIAIDYAKKGIRCNCVCPGGVDTPMLAHEIKTKEGRDFLNNMHPMGRMGKPEDVAYAALYFASDESSWVTGSILAVDGGYTAA